METGKKKRPILLWQMIILVVLPLIVIVSAFFPRISISAGKIADIYKNMYESAADMVSDATGGLLGGSGLGDLMGDPDEAAEEMRESLEKGMKHELSFTGWEIMFLTDDMVVKKLIHMTGEDEKLDQEELEKAIEDFKEGKNQKILDAVVDFLGYMKVGYMLLYIGCLLLMILSVLWFVFKWDGAVFVFINLAVSLGSSVVTVLGILNMGTYALDHLGDAVDLDGILGSSAGMLAGLGDAGQFLGMLTKPMRLFSIAINMTFGGIGCTIVCMIMFLFAVYMMIDHFTLAKRRAAAGGASMPAGMGAVPGAVPGAGQMPGAYQPQAPSSSAGGLATSAPSAVPVSDGLAASAVSAPPAGKITVTRGEFSGAEVEVRDGEEVILGRDPAVCHLVFTNSKISRKHCGVRYNPNTNTYFVKNYSMNGTSFASGQSVSSDVFVEVTPGSIIQLSEGREEIVLG